MVQHRGLQQRSADRRMTILAAARGLLAAEGMRAVTHRRVAGVAGVPVGSVGYYFSTREDLLVECLAAEDEERTHAAQRARDGATPGLPPHDVGERIVLTIWGERSQELVGRVWAAMDGVREGAALLARMTKGRDMLDADLHALLTACGYPAHAAGLALAIVNGSIVNSGIEGHTAEAFTRAARDVAALLEQLGRDQDAP